MYQLCLQISTAKEVQSILSIVHCLLNLRFLQFTFLYINDPGCLPKNDAPIQAPLTHPGIMASQLYSHLYP
jgi:hypothetical protein